MIWIRIAIAVLVAYLVMTASFILTIVPAASLIDPDRLRDPDTGLMTNWFIFVVQFPIAIFTSLVGGLVAALVAGRRGRRYAIRGLITLVIVAGLFGAVASLFREPPSPAATSEAGETPNIVVPVQPYWDLILLPLVGGLGALMGGRLIERASEGLALPKSDEAADE